MQFEKSNCFCLHLNKVWFIIYLKFFICLNRLILLSVTQIANWSVHQLIFLKFFARTTNTISSSHEWAVSDWHLQGQGERPLFFMVRFLLKGKKNYLSLKSKIRRSSLIKEQRKDPRTYYGVRVFNLRGPTT